MTHHAAIGLGANLASLVGAPQRTLPAAIDDLSAAGRVTARSSLYRTEPVGNAVQPPFLNAAVLLETAFDPEALLEFLLKTERRYGRDRSRETKKGPRTLDLDLLLMDDFVLDTPRLTLPHSSLAERRFVLTPLAEIAPSWRHPQLGKTMAELLAELRSTGVNRAEAVQKLVEERVSP